MCANNDKCEAPQKCIDGECTRNELKKFQKLDICLVFKRVENSQL